MDKARMGSKLADLATDSIIETQAHTDNQVSSGDGMVDICRPMHPWHANGQRVCLRERTQAKQGSDDRNMCFLSKDKQLLIGIR